MKTELIPEELQILAGEVELAMRKIDDGVSIIVSNGPYGTHDYEFISNGNDDEKIFTCGWRVKNLRQIEFVFKCGELNKLVLNSKEELVVSQENAGMAYGHLVEFARLIQSYRTYNTQF